MADNRTLRRCGPSDRACCDLPPPGQIPPAYREHSLGYQWSSGWLLGSQRRGAPEAPARVGLLPGLTGGMMKGHER